MNRVRERQDYFTWRGDRYAFHPLVDGPSLARLDPYCEDEQKWPLHSRRMIFPTGAEVRDIARQTQGLELPGSRPEGTPAMSVWDNALHDRVTSLEDRVAVLEAMLAQPDEPEEEDEFNIPETPPLGYADEAPEPEPEPVVEAPEEAGESVELASDGVPETFRALMMPDELPEKFTLRMKLRMQALKHLQIDGTKPTNARALPDMTEEEITELADLEARNVKSGNWLG